MATRSPDTTYGPLAYRKQGGSGIVIKAGGTFDWKGAVAGATITVDAEDTDGSRPIQIQLLDDEGNDIEERQVVRIAVFADANGDAIAATGGSTGLAIGTDGAILSTITAKKLFEVISEADGDIDLTWTDTSAETAYIGVILPNGKVVISSTAL